MLKNFKLHHIGVLTESINLAIIDYMEAGFKVTEKTYDPIQDVNICFLSKRAHPNIELIEPASSKSKVFFTLQKNGAGPYHFCYKTSNLIDSIELLRKMNFILLSNPIEAVAIRNKQICFLYKKEIGLIELVQS
ncbi:MAG: VOC family protein [Tissierellia bacterium]|nr:VOC family protein [Tissierellia bacterium]